jgi:hypothetical protein
MGVLEAADGLYDLFMGRPGPKAQRGALLLGAVLLGHLPDQPTVVVDEVTDG